MASVCRQLSVSSCTQQLEEDCSKLHLVVCPSWIKRESSHFCHCWPQKCCPTPAKQFGAPLSCNQCYFSIKSPLFGSGASHHPENFVWLLTICLAQITLTCCSCSILLIYRINWTHYKAVIHLLCNETAFYIVVSILSVHIGEMQSCLAQELLWWICSAQGYAHPYSFKVLLNPKVHLTQVVLMFRNTQIQGVTYLNAPQGLLLQCSRRTVPYFFGLWSCRKLTCIAQGLVLKVFS